MAQVVSVERRRTGGMTAVAVLNILFGSLGILNGLFFLFVLLALMREMLRLGVFDIAVARTAFVVVALASGIVGVTAGGGILALRPWARPLSLAYACLLIACCALSYVSVPIIASIGTYDLRALDS